MDVKEFMILGDQADSHWYYVSKGRTIETLLGAARYSSVLDVGAGSGIFARRLLIAGIVERAVCVDPAYDCDTTALCNGRILEFRRHAPEEVFPLILMMDVLEHVDNDLELLKSYVNLLASGGTAVITVPAFMYLWSDHDEFLGHRRRYRLPRLELLVKHAGMSPAKSRYYFGLLFPFVVIQRVCSRILGSTETTGPQSALKRYPRWFNQLLIAIHSIERMTILKWNRLAGVTAICIARKDRVH